MHLISILKVLQHRKRSAAQQARCKYNSATHSNSVILRQGVMGWRAKADPHVAEKA